MLLTLPGEGTENKEIAVAQAEGVPGTTLISVLADFYPLVGAKATDEEEDEANDDDGNKQEDPELCKQDRPR